ncbi:MAG: hypothetical protein IKD18_05120, partial [Clostridia bacterium]|nr:hypothetical protein [Clostridia bacterium]
MRKAEWQWGVLRCLFPPKGDGAGDSFTAAFIAGIIKGLDIKEVHLKASRLAAYVCTQQG